MSLDEKSKQELLKLEQKNIVKVQKSLELAIKDSEIQGGLHKDKISTAELHEALMQDVLAAMGVDIHTQNIENYKYLKGTPYFSRCEVIVSGTNEVQTFYFAKFPFFPENIYSWIAPAARMRFEEIGEFNFETVNHNFLKGRLLRKDNYMIVDGKIIFMSSESYDYERTLIHQEFLSNRKQAGFQMQDIVAMMEKAQDQVIRANPFGSFLIAGPAGSGKTTLALHRVAYLVQSPETSEKFPSEKIIVFVQDQSTKDYFSALLPNLGITDVIIETWIEWALKILNLQSSNYKLQSEEDIQYEFEKIAAIRNMDSSAKFNAKNYFQSLKDVYLTYFSVKSYSIFKKQAEEKKFDKYDLTVLLKLYLEKEKVLHLESEEYVQVSRSKLKKKKVKEEIFYNLIIVDEAQNYLKEQIEIIQSTINPKTKSVLYVGDLVQQTRLGTIRNWDDVGENFEEENKVVLTKVYRNTKQILEYIKSQGYNVDTAENLRDGKPVVETQFIASTSETFGQEAVSFIQNLIDTRKEEVLGILVKTQKEKTELQEKLNLSENSKLLTIAESQGVEFDLVVLIKNDFVETQFIASTSLSEENKKELEKVNRDLLYVAMTRAMNELYVLKT